MSINQQEKTIINRIEFLKKPKKQLVRGTWHKRSLKKLFKSLKHTTT